jgi:hypothetical protein
VVQSRGHAAAVLTKLAPHEQVQAPRLGIELRSPVQDHLRDYVDANRVSDPARMVTPDRRIGHSVAIMGAGPSLAHASDTYRSVDAIWACNSAVPYLASVGVPITVAVGIDQTKGLLREWATPRAHLPYYLASSVDPELVQHLESHGCRVSFFHNHVGFAEDEFEHYCGTWPPTLMVGEGFTVVSRAIGLALWMGYERIDVYGADCAFDGDVAHANGEVATEAYHNPLIMAGEINGRVWKTRPDMLMDAVHLVRRVRQANGKIRLMGDTLPVALLGKDDAFLTQVAERLLPGDPRNPAPLTGA